jgi:hypothetical protein
MAGDTVDVRIEVALLFGRAKGHANSLLKIGKILPEQVDIARQLAH